MKRILLSFLFVMLGICVSDAQITVSIPDTVLPINTTSVSVPVNVTNFTGIGAVSLVINYDPNVLTFTGATNEPSHGTFLPPNATNGQILISWFDVNPLNIGNGVLLDLNFNFQHGSSNLNFVNTSCEIADTGANVLNINYINGKVSLPALPSSPSTISGKVWFDQNNDGLIDNGEKGVQWVTVNLYNCSGTWLKWTLTDSAGEYKFDSLNPGSYYVTFDLINGNSVYKFTKENIGSDSTLNSHAAQLTDSTGQTDCVTLSSGQVYSCLNAGLVYRNTTSQTTGSIGDFVWKDTDPNDGIQRPGDPGIPGVTVKLFMSSDSLLSSTTTDSSGHYYFTDLNAGNYYVQFILPAGYIFVVEHNGTDTTLDSDANPSTGKTNTFYLAPGENLMTIDAGMSLALSTGNPSLWITNSDNTDVAPDSGQATTYKIIYGNSGSGILYNAVVVDTLPSGMSFVSSTKGNETFQGSNIFQFNLGTLNPGDSGEVDLTAMISSHESGYYNTAFLQGNDSQSNLLSVYASDLDLADTTSNSGGSGLESRGDMAEYLLKRLLKIHYGMTTPLLKKSGVKGLASAYSLSSFVPKIGPLNSAPVENTPFDILGVSNAVSAYAVNYQLKTSGTTVRVGGIFSTITTAPYIYDHLKSVCDRLAGYQIDEIKLININGYQFYAAKLEDTNQKITDYAISFSVYETTTGYQVQNKWTYEEYQSPSGASSIYNFQVWSNTYTSVAQLVQEILAKFSSLNNVTYLNTNQNPPNVFINSARYSHDGNIYLTLTNTSQSAKQINLNLSYRISQGDDPTSTNSEYTLQPGINNLAIPSGIISDANIYMSQQQGFDDEVYVSGGAYTYLTGPNSTVTTFNTTGYPQQTLSSYPQGSLVLSGGASAAGQLNDWATIVRSLNAENTAYDLSKFGSVRFNARGNGTVEVILNLSNTMNYNYFMYKINLTSVSQTYTIDFNQFKLLDGSQGTIDPSQIEDIGFIMNTTDNQGLSNFDFEVKDIAFLSTDVTALNDQQNSVPKNFTLSQNYPNPFNPSTVIEFANPKQEHLTLTVYNILGQRVAQLIDANMPAGQHSITFDATKLSSGIYFYRLLGSNVNIVRKMILTK